MNTRLPSRSAFSPAEALIHQQIERLGPLDFSTFVDVALYHPLYGYYSQKGPRRGRAGDYFTSLQVSPLFPHIFADVFLDMWRTLGSEQFCLVEMGGGDGEFLEGVLKELTRRQAMKGLRVWAVEKSRPARDALWRRLSRFPRCTVVPSMEDIEWMGGVEGCVFSNEFFDALPFSRLKKTEQGWRQIAVDRVEGRLTDREKPLETKEWLDQCGLTGLDIPLNHEIEVRPAMDGLLASWSALLARGYVLTIDYGVLRPSYETPLRPRGTWKCFYRHTLNEKPYENIGRQDITAHLDFSHLAEAGLRHGLSPAVFASQGLFLSFAGQKRIQAFLDASTDETRRARAGAVQQLIHPEALGGAFSVLLQTKGVATPPLLTPVPTRLRRLGLPLL